MSQTDSPKPPNYVPVYANNGSNMSICSLRETKLRASFPIVDSSSFCQFLEREKGRVSQCCSWNVMCPNGLQSLYTESPAGDTTLKSCKTLERWTVSGRSKLLGIGLGGVVLWPPLPNHTCNGSGCLWPLPSCLLHHSGLYPCNWGQTNPFCIKLLLVLDDNSEKRNQSSQPYGESQSQRGSRKSHLEASMPASHQLIFNTLTTRKQWLRQWQGADFSAAFSALEREGTSRHISTFSHFNVKYLSAVQPAGSYSEADS